ncbi:MAG TPA: glycosyltransferase family 4 protein [Solirubrobacteraceae bacterium]
MTAPRARVAVLEAHDWGAWSERHARGEVAGELGPYGAQELQRHGFALSWSDGAGRLPWRSPLLARPLRKLGTLRPELAGARDALSSLRAIGAADLALAMFEDQGLAPAFLRAGGVPPFASRPLVLVVCWLAETCRELDEGALAAHRRALAGADRVCFFSRNQAEVFERELGVPGERLRCVPFGIDDRFFAVAAHDSEHEPRGEPSASSQESSASEPYVLAIGRDRSRDHRTLLDAVRGTDIPVLLVAPQSQLAALAPPNVRVLESVDHRGYRDLLARAAVVAVPTTAPRYPSGQTVVLEAMAMGKALVTSDSPAMRDYVQDGRTGLLTAPGEPRALAEALAALLADPGKRCALGAAAREAVCARFNHRTMWAALAGVLAELTPRERAQPAGRVWRLASTSRTSPMSSARSASSRSR